MRRMIQIGGAELELCSNAAVPLYYKRVFNGDDLLGHLNREESGEERTEVQFRLMFIEAMLARGLSTGEMIKLREEDYIDWLAQFDYLAALEGAQEALSCFLGEDSAGEDTGEEDAPKNAQEEQSAV